MSLVLALDYGGTKQAAGLVDLHAGRLVLSRRRATPAGSALEGYASMLVLGRELLAAAGSPAVAIGVSFGGACYADGRRVRLSTHVPGWHDFPLAERLEQDLGLPCAIANDADAAALAEQRWGAGRGVAHMIYLTVSTGIGGGIIADGRLLRGVHAWAGELGHTVLDPAGPACDCGRNGCVESFASGRSIARIARERVLAHPGSRLANYPIEHLSAQIVAESAAAGDRLASAIWSEALGWLGIAVANAANLLNPARIVIGGGLTRAGEHFFGPLRAAAGPRTLDPALAIVPAGLGDQVGLLGGAAIAGFSAHFGQ